MRHIRGYTEPPIPYDQYYDFVACVSDSSDAKNQKKGPGNALNSKQVAKQVKALKQEFLKLPLVSLCTLKHLFKVLPTVLDTN